MENLDQQYDSVGNNKAPQPHYQSPASNPGVVYQPANTPTNPGALKVARQTSENIVWKAKDGGTVNIGTQLTSPSTTEGAAGLTIFNADDIEFLYPVVYLSDSDASPTVAQFSSFDPNNPRSTTIPLVNITDNSLQEDAALSINASEKSDAINISQQGNGYGITVNASDDWNWLGVWSGATTYAIGDAVIDNLNNLGYRSITDGNLNYQPSTDGGVHWVLVGNKQALLLDYKGADSVAVISNTNSSNFNSPLEISTNAIISSHFCKLQNLNAVGHSKHIYTSDGTDPNGTLTGRRGDICLDASASGQMAYCDTDNSTSWTLI